MKWSTVFVLAASFAVAGGRRGDEEPVERMQAKDVRTLPIANDALALALADLSALGQDGEPLISEVDQPFVRYIWVTSDSLEDAQATSLVINRVSRSTRVVPATPVKRGPVALLRVNLRNYAAQDDGASGRDLQDWIDTWEELQFDPRLNVLLTQDTLGFASGEFPLDQFVRARRKVAAKAPPQQKVEQQQQNQGDQSQQPQVQAQVPQVVKARLSDYEDVDVALAEAKDVVVARLSGAHVDQALLGELTFRTGSQAPLVTHDYFVFRALSAITDKNESKLYETVFGGLYYRFAGVKSGFKQGTDLDNLLEQLGVGSVVQKLTADQVFDRLRSDARVAKFRSAVTSSPREVDILPSLSGNVNDAQRIVAITRDLKRSSVDIGKHPLANVLGIQPDGYEVIWTRANGLHGYAAFNGDQKLVESVPSNIASDRTIPEPHHVDLQPGISCISCHEAQGHGGWQPLVNDAAKLLFGKYSASFGDVSQLDRSVTDTVDRQAGLFRGDPERKLFPRGRDDLDAAVLGSTGPWRENAAGLNVTKTAAAREVAVYRGYAYDDVTPRRALAEIGLDVQDDKAAVALLVKLILPRPAPGVTVRADPRLSGLLEGLSLTRHDWALAQGFAASRAHARLEESRK